MSEPTEQAARETPERNPRAAMMAEIAKQRQEEIAPELQSFDETTGEIHAQERQEQQEQQEPESAQTMRLKVDGQEVEVPADKVIEAGVRALQKESAADKRLQEAAELKRQYEEMVREALAAPEPSKDVQEEVDWEQVIKDAPFDEKAAKKLAERLTATERINPQEVMAPVVSQVQRMLSGRDALAEFKSRYSDLMADENAMSLFHTIERGMKASGDDRPHLERWTEIAERLKPLTAKADIPADKIERKAGIVNVPTAGAKAPQKDEPKPKTASQIIAEAAKARHQRLE